MPVAEEFQQVLPGCYVWQAFCCKSKVDLTSHAVVSDGKLYVIDPIRLRKTAWNELRLLTPQLFAIFLTNGNHERDSAIYQKEHGVPIYADSSAMSELSVQARPHTVLNGVEVVSLSGAGPGEVGFHFPEKRLLVLGDILINLDSFPFALLPEKYATNPKQMRESVQRLKTLDVSTICFAHGLPIIAGASGRLAAL